MIVKVVPGHTTYRENYLRTEDDGVFRLYDTPPDDPHKPHYPDHAERTKHNKNPRNRGDPRPNPTRLEKWLGPSLVEASDAEKAAYEADPERNLDFVHTASADDPDVVMHRAGAIAMAVGQLDHGDPAHWLPDGRPNPLQVGRLAKLVNVQSTEIEATVPGAVRDPKMAKGEQGNMLTPNV